MKPIYYLGFTNEIRVKVPGRFIKDIVMDLAPPGYIKIYYKMNPVYYLGFTNEITSKL